MKERIFKISKFVIAAIAILQLAISQVHIKVITKVFASDIGFYLFLFILFGLVMTFNLSSLKRDSKIPRYLLVTIAAIGAGLVYIIMLFSDIATGQYLTIDVALLSILVSIAAIITYFVGTAVLLLTKEWRGKDNGKAE